MRIEKVDIRNFRSILNGSFNIDSILAIVGQNNAGKSNVISALHSFFHPEKQLENYLNGKNLCGLPRKKTSIEITFKEADDQEFNNYRNVSGFVTIRQEFSNNKLSYSIKKNDGSFENYTGEIKKYVDFILIPINRISEIESDILKKDSIVYKAIEDALYRLSEKRDTFSVQLKKAYDYINTHAFEKIAKEINSYYLVSNVSAIIKNSREIDSTILMQVLGIFISEKDKDFPITYCGSGIQSLFVIGIYQYISEQLGVNYIIAIEEPEVNLHPQAQRQFINSIKENSKSNKNQVVLSTHSTFIIDQLGHDNLVLVKKQNHIKRGFVSSITQLSKTFFVDNDLHEEKYYGFAGFKNSDFFFSSYIIVTESQTDAEVVKILAQKHNIDLSNTSITLMPLGGVENIKYVYSILEGLNIPHCWILDKDYFFDYVNGKKEDSRDNTGFFRYLKEWTSNNERKTIIDRLIPDVNDRDSIRILLNSNHSKALERLRKYNVISMRYNLEMDICSSNKAQTLLYDLLNIPEHNRNVSTLLIGNKKAIKNSIYIYDTVKKMGNRNLPFSFKEITRKLKEIVKEYK